MEGTRFVVAGGKIERFGVKTVYAVVAVRYYFVRVFGKGVAILIL